MLNITDNTDINGCYFYIEKLIKILHKKTSPDKGDVSLFYSWSEIGPSGSDSPSKMTKTAKTTDKIAPVSKLNGTFAIAPTT